VVVEAEGTRVPQVVEIMVVRVVLPQPTPEVEEGVGGLVQILVAPVEQVLRARQALLSSPIPLSIRPQGERSSFFRDIE
jgi:hypothetical protein